MLGVLSSLLLLLRMVPLLRGYPRVVGLSTSYTSYTIDTLRALTVTPN